MSQKRFGLIAAMPEEIKPLLKRIGKYRTGELAGRPRFDFQVGENLVTLVQSGMGPVRARGAGEALIGEIRPDLVVNFGFAGAVRGETKEGEVVLAREVLFLEGGELTVQPAPDRHWSTLAVTACAGCALVEGVFITSAGLEDKKRVAGVVDRGARHPVLEMETAAVLQAAHEAGIPVLALRGVSDGAEEELGFSLEEFCDAELNIRPARVLAALARKPWIVPQLIRLAANSRRAGERLAECLERILRC